MIMNTLRKAFNAWYLYFDPLGPNQRRWVDELNSGRYPQTRMALRDSEGFCCLGVLCEVAHLPKDIEGGVIYYGELPDGYKGDTDAYRSEALAPIAAQELVGLRDASGQIDLEQLPEKLAAKLNTEVNRASSSTRKIYLTSLNDNMNWTLPQIGAFIENYPLAVFKDRR